MIMRTFIFLLCTTVFSLNTEIGLAQEKVTIDIDKEVTIDEVFQIIMDQTKFNFLYPENLFKDMPKVQLKKGVIRADRLISKSIASGKFNVILTENNNILIKKKTRKQQRQITGKVTGEDGMSLAGVTVLVKGTTRGVSTNFDGQYTITVADIANVLMFSSIGYASQEITVGNQNTIDVVMKEEISELDVVEINAGYYKTSQRKATGNISRVESKDIELQPISNPLQAIQGRIAGVSITQVSGVAGGRVDIQIRGRNSLREDGNNPLYVIDGVPYPSNTLLDGNQVGIGGTNQTGSPLSYINPNDIESFQILKDADATAIYGSLGANGVVLITTKKGTKGKTSVSINLASGFSTASKKLDLLNTEQYLEMRFEGNPNAVVFPPFLQERFFPDLYLWDQNRETDWQDELLGGTAEQTTANISVSGGNEKTQFNFGAGYFKETTIFPTDEGFKRISSLLSVNHTSLNNKFNAHASLSFSNTKNTLPSADLARSALTTAPNAPALYDENGEINWENGFDNPIALLHREYSDETQNIILNTNLNYEIFKNLKLGVSFGYNSQHTNANQITPLNTINPTFRSSFGRESSFVKGEFKSWLMEPKLEFNKTYNKLKLSTLIGMTFREDILQSESTNATGFSSDLFLLNSSAASVLEVRGTSFSQYRYNAIYGRVNLDWADKYILNLTVRRDGSSRFGPNKRFGNFGAVGAAWLFSRENLLNDSSWLSFGKLRASYGITGNDQIPDYGYLDSFAFSNLPYNNVVGFEVSRLANNNYSWESVKKIEVGLEFGLFKDKIYTNINWYSNRATDQLVGLPLSQVTGDNNIQFNIPTVVENRGLELVINTTNINTKNFKWNTNFNLTVPQNELLEFDDIEKFPFFNNKWVVGESINGGIGTVINSGKVFEFIGLNSDTGDYEFTDYNNDGSITVEDRQKYVEIGQKYFGGIQNTITYKGFELDFLFQFVKQKGYDVYFPFSSPGAFAPISNQPVQVLDRWQQSGDLATFQRFGSSALYNRYISSDAIITDTSFIRLNNLSLSYNLSNEILEKLKLQRIKVYAQGQNLFTITNYKGLNPEIGGIAFSPPLRTISLGMEITF
ncbi:TonB-dependent receptor [Flavivirga amylovorans]